MIVPLVADPQFDGLTATDSFTFSPLKSADGAAAHALYNRAFDWLTAKGVRQWLLRLDEATFSQRQSAGEAFAIHVDGALAGCVFVAFETIAYYGETLKNEPRWWMQTLVIDSTFAGRGIGERAVKAVADLVRARHGDGLWLHCVNDANFPERIVAFYARLGFAESLRQTVTYPSGNAFAMVVMQREL